MSARHAREEIGRRRCDNDQVRFPRKADVADLALVVEVEEVGEHAIVGQRADRKRRHEILGRSRQHGAHRDIALAEPPDEVEALVGGNAAADNEKNSLHVTTAAHAEFLLNLNTNKTQGGTSVPSRAASMPPGYYGKRLASRGRLSPP